MSKGINVVGVLDDPYYRKLHENCRRVYGTDGIAPTIHTAQGGGKNIKIMEKEYTLMENSTLQIKKVYIRKLTERECFRLMDVDEEYIDRIQASGVSKSQQYKMAGNSIVVGVLEAVFDKMFINKQVTQPTLFDL